MKLSPQLAFKVTYRAVFQLLRRPQYLLLAVVAALLMMGIIIWSLNLDLLRFIFFESPLSLAEKLEFYIDGYGNLYSVYSASLSTGIIVFSTLFGINLAMLVYVLKHQGLANVPKKSGSSALVLAVLSGGCAACGTSLLAPLIASLGATTLPFVRDLGTIFTWLGALLTLYSIYKMSQLFRVEPRNTKGDKA